MKTIFCLAFILSLIGCVANPSLVKKRYAQYGISLPPEEWRQKSLRNADLFFEHVNRHASIYFSTQCEQFSDSPLEALTAQMLVGFNEIEIINRERKQLAEREVLISELTAKIDGVTRYLKIMVLRKNRCVFDGVFNSTIEAKNLAVDFDTMVNNFWAEASL